MNIKLHFTGWFWVAVGFIVWLAITIFGYVAMFLLELLDFLLRNFWEFLITGVLIAVALLITFWITGGYL